MKKNILTIILFVLVTVILSAFAAASINPVVEASQYNSRHTINGTVYYANTTTPVGSGVHVKIYINKSSVQTLAAEVETNEDGTFSTVYYSYPMSYEDGDSVIAEALEDNTWHKGNSANIVYERHFSQGSSSKGSSLTNNEVIGVPEFNTMTFGIAILGLTFALMFVRRKE